MRGGQVVADRDVVALALQKETLRRLVELSRRTGAAAEVGRYQRLLSAEK